MMSGEPSLMRQEPGGARSDQQANTTTVLFVVYQAGMRANGGVRSISYVLEHARTVRSIVVTNTDGDATAALRRFGAQVVIVPELDSAPPGTGRFGQLARVAECNRRVYELVRDSGAGVVHCNDPQALRSAAPGARGAGARVVYNLRAIKADPTPSLSTLWSTPLIDHVVVLSRDMRARLRERMGSTIPISAIYSIVDTTAMKPLDQATRNAQRASLGLAESDFVVGYAASFVKRKQQLALIEEGMPKMLAEVPSLKLVLVGDAEANPSYFEACKRAAERCPAGAVQFAGYTSDVARWMQAWDATIVASEDEGLARSMIESLACGTPVASFDVPSAREILEEHKCGAVAPIGDYQALATIFKRWSEAPDVMRTLGAHGRSMAEELFQAPLVADQYTRLWLELSDAASATPANNLASAEEVAALLACPVCRGRLTKSNDGLRCTQPSCSHFDRPYQLASGWPVLVDFTHSVLDEANVLARNGSSPIKRTTVSRAKRALLRMMFPPSPPAVARSREFLRELERRSEPATLLVIGGAAEGGGGTPLLYASQSLRIVGIDIYGSSLTQVIADAHALPFASGSFDGVLIQAVLEHVLDPGKVVDEIHRVLKPDGLVYAETPFLQQVHEGPYDFTRFTESGHRWLFRRFSSLGSGAVLGVGTQLQWSLASTIAALLRSQRAGRLTQGALFWLRYLDTAFDERFALDSASAVYFLGRRSDRSLTPQEIIDHYQGAQRRAESDNR